jgi:hypothetical protein
LGIGGASALGAGQVGAANAYAGGLSNIGNNFMLSQLLTPQTTAATAGGATTMNPALNTYFQPYTPG